MVLAGGAVGGIVSLVFAGALADRRRRSRVIIGSDLIRAAALAAIIGVGPNAPLAVLVGCSVVLGVGSGLYRPAYMALLPTLVPADAMAGVNALRTITGRFSVIVGGLVAGLLTLWLQPRAILVIDVATFVASILTLIGLRDSAAIADDDTDRRHCGRMSLLDSVTSAPDIGCWP